MARLQPTNRDADFTRACLGFVFISFLVSCLCVYFVLFYVLVSISGKDISRTRVLGNKSDCLCKSCQVAFNMDCAGRWLG